MRARLAVGVVALIGCGRLGFDSAPGPRDAPASSDVDSPPAYQASSVRFDPAGGDYMWTNMLENTPNSGRGTFSAWFHFNGGDGQQQLITVAQTIGFGGVLRTTTNKFHFILPACTGITVLDMQTQNAYTSTSGWIHVLAAWDVTTGKADLYVNDIPDRAANPLIVNGSICYAALRWGIGGYTGNGLDADVADFYSALGTYIDLSVEANRRKFIDNTGRPVDLGPACNGPTGATSTGCFTGDPATWNMNKGVAAGFTLEGDGLAPAASPSD
ncbi:MAG TPA: hypothetical protein VFV99_04935 [Kofleriaceae bacterium]|nr:hypothetical protein [Kofleriaceae bacterium]